MKHLAPLLLLVSTAAWAQPFVLAEQDVPRKSTSAAWVDYDGNGTLDLVFTDNADHNTLFLNLGGTFQRTTFGTDSPQVQSGAFADLDNDGDPDLVIGSLSQSGLLLNDGTTYTPVTSTFDSFNDVRGFDLFDANNDGILDAFLARRRGQPDALLFGDGQGGFVTQPSYPQNSTDSNSLCVSDYDQDGDIDVFTIETSGSRNVLLRNEGGVLTPVDGHPAQIGTSSSVCTWGDADGDGDMDLFLASGNGVSRLYFNEAGTLTEASEAAFPFRDLIAQAADWADVDNDGDLDLVLAGRNTSARVLLNDGGLMTEILIAPELTDSKWITGVAMADYDRDGDLDLALPSGNSNFDEPNYLFDNVGFDTVGGGGNWLQVHLTGTESNRDGIGAWLEATAVIGGETRTLVRERRVHNGRLAQTGPNVHFGLGDAEEVSLTIRWPSGIVQTVGPLAPNQFVSVEEARGGPPPPSPSSPFVLALEEEPRKTSAALWTDVNGDGDLDLLFADALDGNSVFLGDGQGDFRLIRRGTTGRPVTDAVFTDVDNDGDPDLAIASLSRGGFVLNQDGRYVTTASPLDTFDDGRSISAADVNGDGNVDLFLSRRFGEPNILLLGDGAGGFTREPGAHEGNANSNAACWADFDLDGDQDVFVANSTTDENQFFVNNEGVLVPGSVGEAAQPGVASTVCTWGDVDNDGDPDLFVGVSQGGASNLYVNRNGRLVRASARAFPAPELDVFGAAFGDTDNDGDLDLIISGRDHTARLYINDRGANEVEILPALTGNRLFVGAALADYDRDGDLDLALPAGSGDRFDSSLILANEGANGNWLQLRLTGTVSTRDALGARIVARATIGGRETTVVREVTAKASRRSQTGRYVHLGLGDAPSADVTIYWPSGAVQDLGTIATNGFVEATEHAPSAALGPKSDNLQTAFSVVVAPNPARGDVTVAVDAPTDGPLSVHAYDALGRLVWQEVRLVKAGEDVRLTWSPEASVASGSYVVRVRIGEITATRQVTLVR